MPDVIWSEWSTRSSLFNWQVHIPLSYTRGQVESLLQVNFCRHLTQVGRWQRVEWCWYCWVPSGTDGDSWGSKQQQNRVSDSFALCCHHWRVSETVFSWFWRVCAKQDLHERQRKVSSDSFHGVDQWTKLLNLWSCWSWSRLLRLTKTCRSATRWGNQRTEFFLFVFFSSGEGASMRLSDELSGLLKSIQWSSAVYMDPSSPIVWDNSCCVCEVGANVSGPICDILENSKAWSGVDLLDLMHVQRMLTLCV